MNTCNKCKCYTRPNDSKCCYSCLSKQKVIIDENIKKLFEEKPLNFIKGHLGEVIIQNLFSSLGYKVFRYGIENNLTYLNDYLSSSDISDTEFSIFKNRPDLLVLNEEKGKLYWIEVKYRKNGVFKYRELDENYPYQEAFILLIDAEKGFKCIKVSKLKDIKKISNKDYDKYCLSNNKEFNLDKGFVKFIEEHSHNFYKSIKDISNLKVKNS